MKFQIMDQTGHSEEIFDADKLSTGEAMRRFDELTKGRGMRAAVLGDGGKPGRLLKAFDATAETVLFIPALQGG